MKNKQTSYLSLGTNLGDKIENLTLAVRAIHNEIGEVCKISSIYETPSWGFEGNLFFNICIEIKTTLIAEELLKKALEIEKNLGRLRNTDKEGYENRIIDIDIIFFGNQIIKTPHLEIPHSKAFERKFVLVPLHEISKNKTDPISRKSISKLLEICPDKTSLKKIESPIEFLKNKQSIK